MNEAFKKGYHDGMRGIRICPYDSPYLQRHWLRGNLKALNVKDRRQ